MNHIYTNRSTKIKYTIDDRGLLSIEYGVVKNVSTVDLSSNKPKLAHGMCSLPGALYFYSVSVGLICAFSFLIQESHFRDNIMIGLGVYLIISAVALGFVWWKYGYITVGTRVVFDNGEKLYIYKGSNRETYNQIITEIRKYG
jgi:hypothetical protein